MNMATHLNSSGMTQSNFKTRGMGNSQHDLRKFHSPAPITKYHASLGSAASKSNEKKKLYTP